MNATTVFDLGTVLSITTDKLMTTDIRNIYEILNYMTGDNLFTHQLPRMAREMKPIILEQHPELSDIDCSSVNPENVESVLNGLIEKYGNSFPIIPCGLWQHKKIDPQEELEQMVDPSKIFIMHPKDENNEN